MKSLSKFALIALMTSALSLPAFATSSSGSGGSASAGSSGGSSATGTNSGAGGGASVSGSATVGTGAAIGTNSSSSVSAGSNTGTGSSSTTRAQIGTTNTNAGNNTGTGSSGVSRNSGVDTTIGTAINPTAATLRGQVNGRNIDTDTAANTSVIGSGVAGTNVVGGVVGTGSRAAVNGVVNGAAVGTNAAADSLVQYSQNDFVRSDADRSNTLSFDEYMSYSNTTGGQSEAQSRFAKFDVNNDNFLSEAELRASGSAAVSTTP